MPRNILIEITQMKEEMWNWGKIFQQKKRAKFVTVDSLA